MLALREAVRDLPPDPEWSERLARYQNAIDRILARGQRFEDAQVRQVFQALTNARQGLTERLLVAGPTGASTFQTHQMGELQRAIDLAAGDLARTFGPALGRMLADAWQSGIDFTPEALRAIDVSLDITGRLDTAQLVLLQQESAALVSDVSDTFRQQARRELLRGVLAGASVHEVTRNVADLLRTQPRKGGRGRVGIAARAEMIVRTELNAASAIANELRQRQIVETVPEMRKYWRSARDPRVRPDHLAADRRYRPQQDGDGPIPFNDDYLVGGHKGKYPHDPRLPASEVISCRCVSILYKREWFEDTPVQEPAQAPQSAAAGPQGTPVSDALDTSAVKGKLLPEVKEALDSIDKVHGDGALQRIPTKPTSGKKTLGQYRYAAFSNKPVDIGVSRNGSHQASTLVHEIGHFLDHQALSSKPGLFGSTEWARTGGPAPGVDAFDEWRKAVQASDAYARLRTAMTQPGMKIKTTTTYGQEVEYPVDRRFVSYLMTTHELFARSYAQWITIRSGSAMLKQQLDAQRGEKLSNVYAQQWADDDFEPIAAAFDNLFRRKGWLA